MPQTFFASKSPRRWRARRAEGLHLEALETRTLLNSAALFPADAPDILDPASVPLLSPGPQSSVDGTIVNHANGSGDVDWFRLDLSVASTVTLRQSAGSLTGVLSLYNTTEVFNPFTQQGDRYEILGHRLLEQAIGSSITAPSLTRNLAAGTYYLAVSGAGNHYFHPFIEGSGYAGQTGDYTLQVTTLDLGLTPGVAAVLNVEPGAGATLTTAPPVLRVSLSAPPGPGFAVVLRDANGDVPLAWANVSAQAREVQLAPARALTPGTYRLVALDGNGETILATFQVAGVEGTPGSTPAANDQLGGAHNLGVLADSVVVQSVGFIGDDPFYDPANGQLLVSNPSADVDLYHFEITSGGTFGVMAEVFAGRIGSPLDSGVSLFRLENGRLVLVGVNDNTFNETLTAAGSRRPLFHDSLLFSGLTRGHYYLAVSSSGPIGAGNLADPAHGISPGDNGVFDPNLSHSGSQGTTLGSYVLNLVVFADSVAPQVVSSTPSNGSSQDSAPAQVVIQFSEAVNLPLLANAAFFSTFPFPPEVSPAYISGPNSTFYYLRMASYDDATNQATFIVPQHLPNGSFEIHLSGITDLAGNPLAGSLNDDYVIAFTVNDTGSGNGPQLISTVEPNDDPSLAQNLGTLDFNGFLVQRDPAVAPLDSADVFTFQMPATDSVVLALSPMPGFSLPAGLSVVITDQFGVPVAALTNILGNGIAVVANHLDPGTYYIMVGSWGASQSGDVRYQMELSRSTLPENPPPLTNGPAPAVGLRLAVRIQPAAQQLSLAAAPQPRNVESGNPFLSFSTLGPGGLAFLSAGPLGGTNASLGSDAVVQTNFLQLNDLNSALLTALIRLTLLNPSYDYEESGEEEEDMDGAIRESLDLMHRSWEQFLDGLFSMADWMQRMTTSSASTTDADDLEYSPLDTDPLIWEELALSKEDLPDEGQQEGIAAELVPDEAWLADRVAQADPGLAVAVAIGTATMWAQRQRRQRRKEEEEDDR